jgi:hypothetical protein
MDEREICFEGGWRDKQGLDHEEICNSRLSILLLSPKQCKVIYSFQLKKLDLSIQNDIVVSLC